MNTPSMRVCNGCGKQYHANEADRSRFNLPRGWFELHYRTAEGVVFLRDYCSASCLIDAVAKHRETGAI